MDFAEWAREGVLDVPRDGMTEPEFDGTDLDT